MKFYNKNGTVLGAIMGNTSKKADDFVRCKMPSYEETINENEHLYDYVSDRFTVYPPKVGTVTGTTATSDHQSHEITSLMLHPHIPDEGNKSFM